MPADDTSAPPPPGHHPPERGLPIAIVLVLANAVVVLVATLVVFVAGYQVARTNTIELIEDRSRLLIASIEQRLADYLDPVRSQIDYLARIAEVEGDPLDTRRLEDQLVASLAAVPQVSAVAFVTPDLRVVRAFRNRPGQPVKYDDWSDDAGFAASVAEAGGAEAAYWDGMFFAESDQRSYLNLLAPVRRDGELRGVLVAGVSIQQLSSLVHAVGRAHAGNAFILLDRRLVLAHPDLRAPVAGLSDARPLPTVESFGDPMLKALRSGAPSGDDRTPLDDDAPLRVVEVDGAEYGVLLREIDAYGGAPWLLGLYQPVAAVTGPLSRLTIIVLSGLAALIVALALALLVGRTLARPIRDLAVAAGFVRDLDLESAPRIGDGPFREVNQATRAFNTMVSGLRVMRPYIPRPLAMRVLRRSAGGPVPSEERDVTVMFTDVVGFSAFAEAHTAAEVAAFLNEHFSLIDSCVLAKAGTVDKFIGDAVMAFWGAPEAQPDHAERACRAALAIKAAIEADNARRAATELPQVRIRIGIHSGEVLVGNIGAPSRVNYTIIGDTVNIAERVEGLAREVGTPDDPVRIVVSGETARRLGDAFVLEPLGQRELPGRRQQIEAYALRDEAAHAPGRAADRTERRA